MRLLACLLLASAPPSASVQDLPTPTGQAAIGTVTYEWVDSSRAEVVELFKWDPDASRLTTVPANGNRRIVAQLWYPATDSGARLERAPYNPDIEAFAATMTDSARVATYRRTATHALGGAPLAPGGRLPVLVFSPGGGTFRADYTALYEDLASHGYVVVAVSHPGITLMSLTDGRIGSEWTGWRPPPGLSMSLERDSLRKSAEFFARTRDAYSAGDIRFVLDQLRALDLGSAEDRFTGRLDLARVGAFGHSTGGAVVAAAALAELRIRAVIVYDVILPRMLLGEELAVPLMLFGTDDTRYPPGWHVLQRETFTHLRSTGYEVIIRGSGHNSFSDRALLTPSRYPYRLKADRAMEAVRSYTRAFFDTHVRGRPSALLNAGVSHPEVALTMHPARTG